MLFSSKVKEWIAGITKINIQALICLLIQNSLHLYRSKNQYLPLFANRTHLGWMWVAAATDAMGAPTEGVYCAQCAEFTLGKSTNIPTHQQNVHMVLCEEFTLGQSFSTHQQNVHTAHCAEFTRGKDFQLTNVPSWYYRPTNRMCTLCIVHTGEKQQPTNKSVWYPCDIFTLEKSLSNLSQKSFAKKFCQDQTSC